MAADGFSGLIPYAVNFSIVAGAAIYYGRKPFSKYVYQRHVTQKNLVESAHEEKKQAEERFKVVQASLSNFDNEAQEISSASQKSAESEATRILEKAKAESLRLDDDAKRIVSNERKQQEGLVRSEILDLALEKTEKDLRSGMSKDQHSALIQHGRSTIEAEL